MKRMTQVTASVIGAVATAFIMLFMAGCGSSSRISIKGYDDSMLNGKRIFVLLPKADELLMNNSDAYAFSRGVAGAGARDMLNGELRTELVTAFDHRFDSNTVLNYADQPVGGIVQLSATDDFAYGVPKKWDRITEAAHTGNIDYLLVLNHFSISNDKAPAGGKGKESVSTDFSLLDVNKQQQMTSGSVNISVDDPRSPALTYQRLVEALSRKLPFTVPETK